MTQDPGTIGTTCAAISRPNSRTCNRSHWPRDGSKTCHPHQAEQPTSGPGSCRRDFRAGAGHCEHEIRSVNACARLSRFSNSAAGLFSVGRRGVARAAVCGRFSATPARCQASSSNRILRCRRSGSSPIGRDRKQLSSIPASPHSRLCSQARRLPLPPRRRSALMSPMLYDSRPRHCPSKPMRGTGTPQSRPVSVKRSRN